MLSTIFNWIINNLLQSTPIIIGLVVVIGLVAQKKTFGQIIQGSSSVSLATRSS